MKVRIKTSGKDWSIAQTGKGKFALRLSTALKDLGVEITDNTEELVDIDLQIGRFHYRPENFKKLVLRMGPAHVDIKSDYKKLNKPKTCAIKQADGVIYQSQFGKKMCDTFLGKAECKTAVIFNGAEIPALKVVKPYTKLVLACAREWTGQKRLDQIIDAFLLAGVEHSRLNIVGNTKLKSNEKSIKFHGPITDEQIKSFYYCSNTVVDIGYLACCDNVVCEAIANECIVIASSEGGNSELVDRFFVVNDRPWDFKPLKIMNPPRIDVAVLASRIRESLANKYAVETHHIDIRSVAEQYVDFFKEVLK